jgi:pyruvate,water dikinase
VETIRTAPLPADLERQIRAGYAELERRTGRKDVPVAVRSSGESEDLAGASFAGQYQTYLWICGADAVLENMRACWAGMFADTVLSYRQDGQAVATAGDFAICVGIQHMVEARAAGVMFTLDPLNGDRSKIALEAAWGLGEGVVSGDVTPSLYTIDKVTFEIVRRKISPQAHEYRFVPQAGSVKFAEIEAERREAPCVSDAELQELAKQAKWIEQQRGAPQDIEWAVTPDGEIRILQVRPETVWSRRPVSALGAASGNPVSHVLSRLSGVRRPSTSTEDNTS